MVTFLHYCSLWMRPARWATSLSRSSTSTVATSWLEWTLLKQDSWRPGWKWTQGEEPFWRSVPSTPLPPLLLLLTRRDVECFKHVSYAVFHHAGMKWHHAQTARTARRRKKRRWVVSNWDHWSRLHFTDQLSGRRKRRSLSRLLLQWRRRRRSQTLTAKTCPRWMCSTSSSECAASWHKWDFSCKASRLTHPSCTNPLQKVSGGFLFGFEKMLQAAFKKLRPLDLHNTKLVRETAKLFLCDSKVLMLSWGGYADVSIWRCIAKVSMLCLHLHVSRVTWPVHWGENDMRQSHIYM